LVLIHPSSSVADGGRPSWLKVRAVQNGNYRQLKGLLRRSGLHSVCEEARCPNIYECFEQRTATFLILGSVCTRSCAFCAITTGRPTELDLAEPGRLAEAVQAMGLRHVVITSVARDDLRDGGASLFADTIRAVRRRVPECSIEVLIPDFGGSLSALRTVLDARPDILNHNIETVPRLYRRVRVRARYYRSLELLDRAKAMAPGGLTKSGIMVGLGEEWQEVLAVLRDLRQVDCEIVTIGQYLQPASGRRHLQVQKYYTPEEFAEFRETALALGFRGVESGPLVRSSYHAHRLAQEVAAP
jgi:lipoic acid synthetase